MKNLKLLSLGLAAMLAMMSGRVSAMEEASAVSVGHFPMEERSVGSAWDRDDLSSLGSAITHGDEIRLYTKKDYEVRKWFKKNKHLRSDGIVGVQMPPRKNYRAGHANANLTAQERIEKALAVDGELRDAVADEKALAGVPRYELNKFAPRIGEKQHQAIQKAIQSLEKKYLQRKQKKERAVKERAVLALQRKFRKRRKLAARADAIRKIQVGKMVVTPESWVTSESASGSVEGSSPRELRSGPVSHGNLEKFMKTGDIDAMESAESFDRRVGRE